MAQTKKTTQGVEIPAIGLGTSGLHGAVAGRVVGFALAAGYRHFDTAQAYRNEGEVGEAITASSVPRDAIWLTTKISPKRYRDGDLQRSVEDSLRKLKTEPDLLLLHWPNAGVPLGETVAALNEVRRRGLTRHIGVSNFTTELIRRAAALSEAPLIVDQVEYHPYLGQGPVLDALRARGMILTAYSPLARGRVLRDPLLQDLGARHGKTAGQVALRWLVQQDGVVAIPRSTREAHLEANLEVFDFVLSEAEMAEISARATPWGRISDPLRHAPLWDGLAGGDRVRRKYRQVVTTATVHLRRLFGVRSTHTTRGGGRA